MGDESGFAARRLGAECRFRVRAYASAYDLQIWVADMDLAAQGFEARGIEGCGCSRCRMQG